MQRILAVVILLLSVLILASCATTGLSDYAKLQHLKPSEIATTTLQMLELGNIETLIKDDEFSIRVSKKDPVAQFENFRSHYKVFKFDAQSEQSYSVELRSLCNCFGFAKSILYPVTMLVDSKGNIINNKPSTLSYERPSWALPVNIHSILNGQLEKSGTYYIVLAADNQNVASEITRAEGFIATAGIFAPISIPIVSHPTGSVNMTVKIF